MSNVDPWLAKLVHRLAIGVCLLPLGACTVCNEVPIAKMAKTELFAEAHPEVVAELWKISDMRNGRHNIPRATCQKVCGDAVLTCTFLVYSSPPREATANLDCVFGHEQECHAKSFFSNSACMFGCGRLPDDTVACLRQRNLSPCSHHFAEIALLEAHSVFAFGELGFNLKQHGISIALQRRVRHAYFDERRHTKQARKVLQVLGLQAQRPVRRRYRRQPLAQIARDNAVDGCIRETFGALLGCIQCARNTDG